MTASSTELLAAATRAYGRAVKAKLASSGAYGQPEEQLRGPLETFLASAGEIAGFDSASVVFVGESAVSDLQVRPDFAVTVRDVLVGFIEVKAPGKGADPRRFTDKHDRDQWAKLTALPNVLYTDGTEFSVWRFGELQGRIERLTGDIYTAGGSLSPAAGLPRLMGSFLAWTPTPPTSPAQLAHTAARLCRLLRDEVAEQMAASNPRLIALAADWRTLLFPDATDDEFADSYAQAVTFGLLMARVRNIDLTQGVSLAATHLAAERHTLVGTALRILTDGQLAGSTLQTSVATLTRTLSVVDWPRLSKGDPDAWLYFYEDFLSEYDPALRRATGSYYTPVEVVRAMTRLVDQALTTRFDLPGGLASPTVTVLDPALGTGTYLLEVIRRIGEQVADDLGAGAVPGALANTVERIIGFELQMGPYAVAQLRLMAELTELSVPASALGKLRTYVTDTLDDPLVEVTKLGTWYEPIAQSRRDANKIKAEEPVMVVLGNPPYKDKSKGRGGFVEQGGEGRPAPLARFIPDKSLGVSTHVKHLYNPYVYFWRWATDKVFDQHVNGDKGIVCFITAAGFLRGPGFAQMRAYLRERADAIYVIDCTPEGHQPDQSTRIFQGVQQPVCIMLALRDGSTGDQPAPVHFRHLDPGRRQAKFDQLNTISLTDDGWTEVSTLATAPFWPAAGGDWAANPALPDLFLYDGSGTMPGRTWPIAPDQETLTERWDQLITAPPVAKPELFQEHKQDRRIDKLIGDNLPGYPAPQVTISDETGPAARPVRYGYRSFDRQWIIPDKRLINRPNPSLWNMRSNTQIYLTAPVDAPTFGPATTFSAPIPDLHYYAARGGRVWPLWRDAAGTLPNTVPRLLGILSDRLGRSVHAPDVMAYVAAVTSQPGYTDRFKEHLKSGIRVPVTADPHLFTQMVEHGKRLLWLHSYGERFADDGQGRPAAPPRLPSTRAPKVRADYPIPADPDGMPDSLHYDSEAGELHLGTARIGPVSPAVAAHGIGTKNTLTQWFSSRRKHRERPQMGDRRTSPLSKVQPDHWLPEYTTELIDLLHVLGLLTELYPTLDQLLGEVLAHPLITVADLTAAGVLPVDTNARKNAGRPAATEIPTDPDTLF